jgi:hypothetical protein
MIVGAEAKSMMQGYPRDADVANPVTLHESNAAPTCRLIALT